MVEGVEGVAKGMEALVEAEEEVTMEVMELPELVVRRLLLSLDPSTLHTCRQVRAGHVLYGVELYPA